MPVKRTKNRYQQMIAEYQNRKIKLKEQFHYSPRKPMPEIYYERYRRLCRKINKWKEAIRRREKIENDLKEFDNIVSEFTGLDSVRNRSSTGRRSDISFKLFYKFGLENGRQGYGQRLAEYTGVHGDTPRSSRLKFTRSFKTNPQNRELWHQFLRYANDRRQTNKKSI